MNRVGVGVLVTTVMTVTTLMQFALGALGPTLLTELDLSRFGLGALSGVYYLVAAVCSPLLGRLIDRVPARVSITVLLVSAGVAYLLTALAPAYAWLFPGLVLAGAAAAAGNPATNLVLADIPPPRGAIVGIKQSGVQVGALIAGAALPPLAVGAGWRAAFLACAVVAALALPMTAWLPRHPRLRDPVPDEGREALPHAVQRLTAYAFCMGAGMATVTTYLALYGHERAGLAPGPAGLLLAVIGASAVGARIGWSVLAERRRTTHEGIPGALAVMALLATTATVLVALAAAAGVWALWLAALVFGFSGAAWNGVAMLTVIHIAPPLDTARASGRVLAGFFTGLCGTPLVFGALVDATGTYLSGWTLTALMFAAAMAVAAGRPRRWGATATRSA
ncbi:MAG: MFS transporter [Streptomycetales bacterium]